MKGDYIDTYSGKQFWFLCMREDMVCIEDIAHHLAHILRFTGALNQPYSVAQHSVIGSYIPAHPELQYEFLFHDAHEAYFGDMSRPLKRSLPIAMYSWWRERTEECQRLINKKFHVPGFNSPEVRLADERMLLTEKRDFLPRSGKWKFDSAVPIPTRLIPWTSDEAEQHFLVRFWSLQNALGLSQEKSDAATNH